MTWIFSCSLKNKLTGTEEKLADWRKWDRKCMRFSQLAGPQSPRSIDWGAD